jgi:hypothetical protein
MVARAHFCIPVIPVDLRFDVPPVVLDHDAVLVGMDAADYAAAFKGSAIKRAKWWMLRLRPQRSNWDHVDTVRTPIAVA